MGDLFELKLILVDTDLVKAFGSQFDAHGYLAPGVYHRRDARRM
jgi:hypothetical protein